MTPQEIAQVATDHWNANDREAWASLVTDDFQFEGEVFGKEGWVGVLDAWHAAFPDCHMELKGTVADDRSCAGELVFTGTHTGALTFPDGGEVAPTGKSVTVYFGNFYSVRDGLIATFTAYGVPGGLVANGVIPGVQLPEGMTGQPRYGGSGLHGRPIPDKLEIPT